MPEPAARSRLGGWPSARVRREAYDEMRAVAARVRGHGFRLEVPPMPHAEVEAVQAQRDAAFSRYVGAAIDELDGMMKIAALVEGSTPQEVRQKVEG